MCTETGTATTAEGTDANWQEDRGPRYLSSPAHTAQAPSPSPPATTHTGRAREAAEARRRPASASGQHRGRRYLPTSEDDTARRRRAQCAGRRRATAARPPRDESVERQSTTSSRGTDASGQHIRSPPATSSPHPPSPLHSSALLCSPSSARLHALLSVAPGWSLGAARLCSPTTTLMWVGLPTL